MNKISILLKIFLLSLILCLALGVTAFATVDKSQINGNGPVLDPVSDYLSIQVDEEGHFNSGGTRTPADTNSWFNISFDWPGEPGTSFSTVMVDGTPSTFGTDGVLVQAPTDDAANLSNTCIWKYGDVEVKQTLQIVNGSSGLPDTGMYKYTVHNTGTVSHNVGVRVMVDTMLKDNDGAPFRVPGVGAVITEMEFTGENIPQYWQAFYSLDTADIMAQGTLTGGVATTPDRFVLSNWNRISGTLWDYTINPLGSVTGDSAATIWWNPVILAPGESRDFVTYYGLGSVSGTSDLFITGPTSLSIAGGQWSPNPFVITAYIANNTDSTMNNIPVTLSLPTGLDLQSDILTHTISSINPDTTAQTSWNVVPLAAGDWSYEVNANGRTASRQISIPVIERTLTSIAITTPPSKTTYVEGQSFDPTGMIVTATYNDGTTSEVTEYTYAPDGALTTGDSAVTISYEGKTVEQTITVNSYVQVISPANATATAGDIVPFEFTIKNFLDEIETFDLSVSSIKGWDTNITNTSGEAINSVTIDGAGGIYKVDIDVAVPNDIVNDYETITLHVTATSDPAITGHGAATIIVGEPVPDAPTGVTAVAGNGQAVVSFTPPANDGGPELTGYTVTASPRGITAAGITSPITITGLTNGIAYTFTVIATNEFGDSASSIASDPVTPDGDVPDAPTGVTAAAGHGQAVVSFTPPVNAGGAVITGYTVTASPGGITAAGITSPITITGLTNGIAYTFTVVATNEFGDSVSSIASNPATPTEKSHHHGSSSSAADTHMLRFNIGISEAYLTKGSAAEVRIPMDVAPMLVEDRTLLPIRYVIEPMGGKAVWDQTEQKVTITRGTTTIELWIGNNTAKVNGVEKLIDPNNKDVKPILVDPGRTMLPLRFVAEALGCKVDWDQSTQKITVSEW